VGALSVYSIFWEITLLLEAQLMMFLGVLGVFLVNTFSNCVCKRINVIYCSDIVWGIMGML
jgi:hypothetical protein